MIKDLHAIYTACPSDWIQIFATAGVGAILASLAFLIKALIGYFQVNRTEFNDLIVQTETLVSETIAVGCSYWSKAYDAHDKDFPAQEHKIKTDPLRINRHIADLVKLSRKFDKQQAENFVRNFQGVISGGDFEGKKRKADATRCEYIRDIGLKLEKFLADSKVSKGLFN
jgi:hypothetical protein